MYAVFLGRAVETVAPAIGSVTNDMLSSGSFSNITGTGTLTNFTSTGIDDNASSTALTIASDGRNTVDSTNEKPLIIHHSDGSTVNMGFQNNAGNASFIGFSSSDFTVAPAGTERMRVGSAGKVSVGDAIPFDGGNMNGVQLHSGPPIQCSRDNTATRAQIEFKNPNGSVGTITTSSSSTAYNTSSDYRLKENVNYTFDATTRLKELKPARFNFKADANTTVDGFLAHEVSSVVPEAITGTHNEVDEDGNPVYQGIDQSKLVPLLVKTIQELEARITQLENV